MNNAEADDLSRKAFEIKKFPWVIRDISALVTASSIFRAWLYLPGAANNNNLKNNIILLTRMFLKSLNTLLWANDQQLRWVRCPK